MNKIVHSSEPVTLVGGGPTPESDLLRLHQLAPRMVAADGGAAHVLAAGFMPEAVIGDMDSLPEGITETVDAKRFFHVTEQDSTDFEKCLMRVQAPLILGAGLLGGEMAHHLAALHGLLRFADQRCVLLGGGEIVFLCPPVLDLDLPAGTPLSLFPMAPVKARASGLEWSFDALELAPGRRIGTSNRVAGPARVSMPEAGVLCILPDDALDHVVTRLVAQPDSWPARG